MAASQTAIASNNNIKQIAESLNSYAKHMQTIVSTMVNFNQNLASFASLNADDLKKSTSNFTSVFKSFFSVVDNVVNIDKKKYKALDSNFSETLVSTSKTVIVEMITAFKEIQGQFKGFNFDEFRNVLMSSKSTKTTKGTLGDNSNVVDVESTVDEKGGLLDAVNLVLGTFGQMNNLVGMGWMKRIKFKHKFNQLMKVFRWTIGTLFDNKNFGGLSPEKVNTLNIAMKSLSKLMMTFPSFLEGTSSAFLKLGVLKFPIKEGVKVLLGTQSFEKDTKKGKKVVPGKIGLVEAIILTCEEIKYMANDNSIDKSLTKLKNFGVAIYSVAESFAMVGFFAIPIQIAVLVLMGRNGKGGLLRVLVGCLNILADVTDKQVDSAINNINKMSKALLLFSATVVVIALLGALIIVALPLITITFLFMGALLLIFSKLGSKLVKHEVKDGGQTLLNISLAITVLALTAVLIVTLAQFIEAEWETLAMFGVALGGLLLIFAVLGSKMTVKNIEAGTKSILKIALCIALMALIAVGLVLISNYIEGDWEGIAMIGVMMATLTLSICLMSKRAEKIKLENMITIAVCVGAVAASVAVLVLTANTIDDISNLLWVAGIMVAIVGLFVGLAFLASVNSKRLGKGIGALKALATIVAVSAGMMFVLATVTLMVGEDGMLRLLAAAGIMIGVVVAVGGIALAIGVLTLNPLFTVALSSGIATLGTLTLIGAGLALTLQELAKAAKIMKDEKLDETTLFDSLITPINVLETIIKTCLVGTKVKELREAKKKFKQLRSISKSIGIMANTLKDIASLRIPTEFDKDGKPIKWEAMESEDFAYAAANAGSIASIMSSIFAPGSHTVTTSLGDVTFEGVNLDALQNISRSTKRKFKHLSSITGSIGNMATVIQNVAALRAPDPAKGFDEEGNPKGYTSLKTKDFPKVASNTAAIATTLITAIANEKILNMLDEMGRKERKAMEAIFSSIGNLSSVVTVVAQMAKGEIPITSHTDEKTGKLIVDESIKISSIISNKDKISNNIKDMLMIIVKGLGIGVDATGNKDKVALEILDKAEDNIKDLTKVIEGGVKCINLVTKTYKENLESLDIEAANTKFDYLLNNESGIIKKTIKLFNGASGLSSSSVEAFEKQSKSTINVLKQVNDTDLSKLKQTTSLFEEIRKFSQSIRGDFEELAECINEEIITAIEKLEETLTKIKDEGFNVNVSGGVPQQPTVNDMKPTGDKATQATIKNLQDKINKLESGTNAAVRKLGECIEYGRMKVKTE